MEEGQNKSIKAKGSSSRGWFLANAGEHEWLQRVGPRGGAGQLRKRQAGAAYFFTSSTSSRA